MRLKIRTYGSPRARNRLHLVLVRRKFEDIHHFREFAESLVAHKKFNAKPCFFLFPEAPFFSGYLPKRGAVKKVIRSLAKTIQQVNPHAHLAFSINEQHALKKPKQANPSHSNTGYVVGSGRYHAKPKLTPYSVTDFDQGPPASRKTITATSSHWAKRKVKLLSGKRPFSQVTFPTGHTLEYRVCADVVHHRPAEPIATAVSAHFLGNRAFQDLLKKRLFVVVNDSHPAHGSRIVTRGNPRGIRVTPVVKAADLKSLERALAKERVTLHVVEEKP